MIQGTITIFIYRNGLGMEVRAGSWDGFHGRRSKQGGIRDDHGLTPFLCRRTINGIIAMRSFMDQFSTGYRDKNDMPAFTPEQISIIVAMLSAGTVVGALVSAPVGDYFGRRLSLIGAVAVFCFGVIFQICANDIPLLLVGRYVEGFAYGLFVWC